MAKGSKTAPIKESPNLNNGPRILATGFDEFQQPQTVQAPELVMTPVQAAMKQVNIMDEQKRESLVKVQEKEEDLIDMLPLLPRVGLKVILNIDLWQKCAEIAILITVAFFVIELGDTSYTKIESLPNSNRSMCLDVARPYHFRSIDYPTFQTCSFLLEKVAQESDISDAYQKHLRSYKNITSLRSLKSDIKFWNLQDLEEMLIPVPYCNCLKDNVYELFIDCAYKRSKLDYLLAGFILLIFIFNYKQPSLETFLRINFFTSAFFSTTLVLVYINNIPNCQHPGRDSNGQDFLLWHW